MEQLAVLGSVLSPLFILEYATLNILEGAVLKLVPPILHSRLEGFQDYLIPVLPKLSFEFHEFVVFDEACQQLVHEPQHIIDHENVVCVDECLGKDLERPSVLIVLSAAA